MPDIKLFHHFFYPDEVVSSRLMTELAQGLVKRGWSVDAHPCNRRFRSDGKSLDPKRQLNGIEIRRIWRPPVSQQSGAGRLFNAVWMIAAWVLAAMRRGPSPRFLIVGSDPIFSILVALFWKALHPKTKIVHWCFDLYPEAAIADGLLSTDGLLTRLFHRLLRMAYRRCDSIVNIGGCMHDRLSRYADASRCLTLTPWSMVEPDAPLRADPSERAAIFGKAAVALMYSGTFGRAHSLDGISPLLRILNGTNIKVAFSVPEEHLEQLRGKLGSAETDVAFLGVAPVGQLAARLGAADIHIVILKKEWTGISVPSKFFGALAVGRPVLFVGSAESSIARWIRKYKVGWVLEDGTEAAVAEELQRMANNPAGLHELFAHCHRIYHKHFAREFILSCFHEELLRLDVTDGLRTMKTTLISEECEVNYR